MITISYLSGIWFIAAPVILFFSVVVLIGAKFTDKEYERQMEQYENNKQRCKEKEDGVN